LDRLSLSGRLSGTSAEIWNLSGAGFGGVFTGAVDMAAAWSPDRTLERLCVAVRGGVDDMSGSALARAFGLPGAERYEGRLSIAGGVNGATGPDALQTLRGEGRIRLTAGRLFRVPVFSPLIEFLDRLIPGADLSSSRTDAAADWTLADGQVRAESIVVGGDLINLSGHGAYALTRNLDFDIQVKLMKDTTLLGKAVRALTLPVSKLFEFRVRGTPGRPHWYPVNFSSDLLEKIPFTGRGGASQSEPAGP